MLAATIRYTFLNLFSFDMDTINIDYKQSIDQEKRGWI